MLRYTLICTIAVAAPKTLPLARAPPSPRSGARVGVRGAHIGCIVGPLCACCVLAWRGWQCRRRGRRRSGTARRRGRGGDLRALHEARPAKSSRSPQAGAELARARRRASGRSLRGGRADRAEAVQGGGDPPRGVGASDDDDRAGRVAGRGARPGGASLGARRRSGARLCSGRSRGGSAAQRSRSADRPRGSGGIGGVFRQGGRRSRPCLEGRPGPRRRADLPRRRPIALSIGSILRSPMSRRRSPQRRTPCRRCSSAATSAA